MHYSHIHCALSATSKFDFEPLFDIEKKVQRIFVTFQTKQFKKVHVFISPFSQQLGEAKLIVALRIVVQH